MNRAPLTTSGSNCRLVYCTASSVEEATNIGRTLVGEGLVACVNIIPQMTSIYRWQGQIHQEAEVVLIAKTLSTHVERTTARIKELHSYDCPAVLSLTIEQGSTEYLDWIAQQVNS